MLKHIMTALGKEKMKNRTKSNLSDFSLVETERTARPGRQKKKMYVGMG